MFKNIQAVILDMDGVLWRGPEWLIDPADTFDRLHAAGLTVTLATNNATRSIDHYIDKFAAKGVHLTAQQVINSAAATAKELARRHPQRGEVFVLGEWGLGDALQKAGFTIGERNPLAVVCGMDRQLTYEKLRTATFLVRSGVPFIGTNPDRSFPTPEGLAPGAGSILAALEAASDVVPEIIGKPQPTMYRQLLETFNLDPEHALVVGDRLETDIAGGQALGCRTAVVLSGVSTLEMAEAWQPAPDYIFPDLNALVGEMVPA